MAPRSSTRVRLDELLVLRGLTPTREKARALVLAGRVSVPGLAFPKPGQRVPDDLPIDVAPAQAFVGRGGLKLCHALERFAVSPQERTCADIGASTGGFTDCLLQRGARRVYAVDVGYGQLDFALRQDARVVVMERTNARYLESLPELVSLVVMDVSFISLKLILPAVWRIVEDGADVIALVKPQFEAGRGNVGKGGIVRDPRVHREVLVSLAGWLEAAGQAVKGIIASPIRGAEGNTEFLMHVSIDASRPLEPQRPAGELSPGVAALIEGALAEAQASSGEAR
jgi:23S rRNA (cytidine1920-2'-O)/16S rRNA (cytidine1409-2'-O)-methyltransferase